jgi:hypothetical protein
VIFSFNIEALVPLTTIFARTATMQVSELIEQLQKLDPAAKVQLSVNDPLNPFCLLNRDFEVRQHYTNATCSEVEGVYLEHFDLPEAKGYSLPVDEVFSGIRAAVSRGGDAGRWLGDAYLSWYRSGGSPLVDLNGFESLDSTNRLLFTEMLGLRQRPGWSDEALWKLEKDITDVLYPPDKYAFEINPRPDTAGGGWQLRLLENGEEVGGAAYPASDEDGYSDAVQYGQDFIESRQRRDSNLSNP